MLIQCLCSRWLRGLIWGPGGVFFNKKGPKSLDTVPINYIFAHKLTQRCPGSGIVFFFYLFLAAKEGFSFFFEILQYYTMTLSGHSCSTKYLICLLYSAYCTYWGVEYWISLLYSAYCTGVWNIEYLSCILPTVLGCGILNISPLFCLLYWGAEYWISLLFLSLRPEGEDKNCCKSTFQTKRGRHKKEHLRHY